jgi:hypothetical protein
MDENQALSETPEEKAYFDSAGAKPVPETQPEPTQAAPETKPEPVAEQKPDQPKTVPHQALHEERTRRKEAERRAQQLEERFTQLLEKLGQGEKPKPPSVDEDPVGVVKTHDQELKELREWQRQQSESVERENQYRAFVGRYQASAQEFAREHPDFSAAYDHWQKSVVEELREAGWTDAEIPQQVRNFETSIAAKAFAEDVNPAQRIYNIAKRRGYSSKAEPKAEDKIATLQKGAQAAKSLSSASGNQSPPLTLEALAEMDDEDFDRNWDKVMKQANARR